MTYGAIQTAYGQLRRRLAIYVGERALPAITVDAPRGTKDEHSFSQLVVWAYVLLHETGRVSLGFLKQLPPWSDSPGPLLPYVRPLRTWTSHNLELDKEADIKTLRLAVQWFSETCGVGTPTTPAHWRKCFARLADDLRDLLGKALLACDAFENLEDRQGLIDNLTERIDRNWAAYRFDEISEEVFVDLGYRGIEVVTFRTAHLDAWRRVVAASKEDDIRQNLRVRIEADVLAMMNHALPWTAEEIAKASGIHSKQELISVLVSIRAAPVQDRLKLLGTLMVNDPDSGKN